MLTNSAMEAVNLLLNNPSTTFIGSLTLSATIILLDLETGFSVDLPGRGRLGLAAFIAVIGSATYFLGVGGLTALTGEIAAGIFGSVITATIIAYFLRGNM